MEQQAGLISGWTSVGGRRKPESAERGPRPAAEATMPRNGHKVVIRGEVETSAPALGLARVEPPRPESLRGDANAAIGLAVGDLVGGRFTIMRELGRGPSGVVFEAKPAGHGPHVAIKALRPSVVGSPSEMWRWKHGLEASTGLGHPNIAAVWNVGQTLEGMYYVVEELLEGASLRTEFAGRTLSTIDVLDALIPVMGALVAAHHRGIIHRNITPDNIVVCKSAGFRPFTKLTDFGHATLGGRLAAFQSTERPTYALSPYVSPEQSYSDNVDPRTDVWSLGVVLFELLTGQCPFRADANASLLEKIRTWEPKQLAVVAPQVPEELADIVHGAIERDLSRRFSSMLVLLASVSRFVERTSPAHLLRHEASVPSLLLTKASLLASHGSVPDSGDPFGARAERARSVATEPRKPREPEGASQVHRLQHSPSREVSVVPCSELSRRELARVRLVSAMGYQWSGQLGRAQRHAEDSLRHLSRGSAAWFAALATLIQVLSAQGKTDRLIELADHLRLARVGRGQVGPAAYQRALAQSAMALLDAGEEVRARRLLERVESVAQQVRDPLPLDVSQWVALAHADLLLYAGDPSSFLAQAKPVVEWFRQTGDLKNACVARARLGDAYMQLGAYLEAERELRGAVVEGESAHVGAIAPGTANLGLCLARMGRLPEAKVVASEALRRCLQSGYVRSAPLCRLHLSEVHRLDGRLPRAVSCADKAVRTSQRFPSVHSAALATLSVALLESGHKVDALAHSLRAIGIIESVRCGEESEALVHLAHVRALVANGRLLAAKGQLTWARERLHLRAAKISDLYKRRRFLEDVPENRHTLELALPLK